MNHRNIALLMHFKFVLQLLIIHPYVIVNPSSHHMIKHAFPEVSNISVGKLCVSCSLKAFSIEWLPLGGLYLVNG